MPSAHRTNNEFRPQLMNIGEVAAQLGVDVRHVRRLVHERRIPYIKWGHLLRFDPDEIAAWINTYRRAPRSPRI
jgi:excisionase family DNA binding protein